jgi:hypothetical protein
VKRILLATPLLVVLLALGSLASQSLGLRPSPLPQAARLLLWSIEAAGLAGLFLIARGTLPTGAAASASLSLGLAVALAAWIFRGPVVATTLLAAGALGRAEARTLSVGTLVAYLICGVVLGWVGRPPRSASL